MVVGDCPRNIFCFFGDIQAFLVCWVAFSGFPARRFRFVWLNRFQIGIMLTTSLSNWKNEPMCNASKNSMKWWLVLLIWRPNDAFNWFFHSSQPIMAHFFKDTVHFQYFPIHFKPKSLICWKWFVVFLVVNLPFWEATSSISESEKMLACDWHVLESLICIAKWNIFNYIHIQKFTLII